jgi:hypothetical protein
MRNMRKQGRAEKKAKQGCGSAGGQPQPVSLTSSEAQTASECWCNSCYAVLFSNYLDRIYIVLSIISNLYMI